MMVNRSVLASINSGDGFDLYLLHTAAPPGRRIHASTESKEHVFKHGKCQIREHKAFNLTTIYVPVKKLDKKRELVSLLTMRGCCRCNQSIEHRILDICLVSPVTSVANTLQFYKKRVTIPSKYQYLF
jgi:hypothetical protein